MGSSESTALVWFRNDLRIHDHYAWNEACKQYKTVKGVYILDSSWLSTTSTVSSLPKVGAERLQFILESLNNLQQQLRRIGSDLIVRVGQSVQVLSEICQQNDAKAVFCHEEVTDEEIEIDTLVETHLESKGIGLYMHWGSTLYHPDDLPFETDRIPNGFTSFRKKIEAKSSVRAIEPTLKPQSSVNPTKHDTDGIPTLNDLGYELNESAIPDNHFRLEGGESKALERLKNYVFESKAVRTYKETRNELLGLDYSTKFSAWLSLGCISPRKIYHEIKKHEAQYGENDSTYWVIFELLWRDFFRFTFLKEENKLFQHRGILKADQPSPPDALKLEKLRAWSHGETGIPFIDANMKELLHTGFMSNRGRQNVASYLVHVLECDWRWGAEWFEYKLVDYDPCSNWGNWAYVAGVGNDPRSRYFNVLKQAKDYDPTGKYVSYWLPQLKNFGKDIQTPFRLNNEQWLLAKVEPNKDYPYADIDPEKIYQKKFRK